MINVVQQPRCGSVLDRCLVDWNGKARNSKKEPMQWSCHQRYCSKININSHWSVRSCIIMSHVHHMSSQNCGDLQKLSKVALFSISYLPQMLNWVLSNQYVFIFKKTEQTHSINVSRTSAPSNKHTQNLDSPGLV